MEERRSLDSWKEIAAYLRKSEKTCRNWEKKYNLPVHRLDGSPKAHVFSYTDEIDLWMEQTGNSKAQTENSIKKGFLDIHHPKSFFAFILKLKIIMIVTVILAGIILTLNLVKPFSSADRSKSLDSIAILPFINDSNDPGQDYFANSLTDLLINELYKVAALNVASRQDVMRYKDSGKGLKEIARELNVEALVEASVLKSEDRIRITARLIDPYKNNRILWAETMEQELSEILLLQSDIAQAIVSGIKVAVTPEEIALLAVDREVDPEAYDLFLRGRERYRELPGPEETNLAVFLSALNYLQKSIDIDPNLAQAHAWKAHILFQVGSEGFADSKEVYPKAREAALKALKLNEHLAEAHRTFGLIKMELDWDFRSGEREMKRALDLNPGDGMTRLLYPRILACAGKTEEAVTFLRQHIKRVQREYSKRIWAQQFTLSFLLFRRYGEALNEQKHVVSSNAEPNWGDIITLAVAYALSGMHSKALDQIEKVKDLHGPQEDAYFLREQVCVLGLCGRRQEALEKLEELKSLLNRTNIDSTYFLACVYASLRDEDKAFEHLDRAFMNHSPGISWLLAEYWLHNLQDDPRFEVLRKKMGI